ncbi:MAG: tRNA 2-thiouridine(34) synthase MnmA [Candidatus Cloacimonetes bacterium]|nr:tRNA 2-thiouridine(34) synthase MnmA [Candidatus Cloacimonadota bacterium]
MALGLSGGVDSAAAAILLKDAGYEVIGITMSIYDPSLEIGEAVGKGCFGPNEVQSLEAARKVADALAIPHHIIDLKKGFQKEVLAYYTSSYQKGQTPNPCVMCNAHIKFGLLPQKAREEGLDFDLFATGHYVQKKQDPTTGLWQIYKGLDASKDQSYFLCFLNQLQLASTLFPLGALDKREAREIVADKGLDWLLVKKESQDFIQSGDHAALFDDGSHQPGDMVDSEGRILGQHRGLIHYTIGQRKGLGISGQPEPMFVIRIDAQENKVVVGTGKELFGYELTALNPHWISGIRQQTPQRALVRIRQQHIAAPASLTAMDDGNIRVKFDKPQLAITPGQIVAFYEGERLLGGGVIEGRRSAAGDREARCASSC